MAFDPTGKIEFFDTLVDGALHSELQLSGEQWTILRRLRARKPTFGTGQDMLHILILLLGILQEVDEDVNIMDAFAEHLVGDEILNDLDRSEAPPNG